MSQNQKIQQLIDSLFEHPNFQNRLRSFVDGDSLVWCSSKQSKSLHTDVSERLQQSNSKYGCQVEAVVNDIDDLLYQLYQLKRPSKITYDRFDDLEICRIFQNLDDLRQQISNIKYQFSQQVEIAKMINSVENPELSQNSRSFQQYKNWEEQLMEKIDLITKRNYKKVQSIFADKLNSFQMSLMNKIGKPSDDSFTQVGPGAIKEEKVQAKGGQLQQNSHGNTNQLNAGKEKAKNEQQSSLAAKTLKSVKSVGSLFRFKN